MRGVWFRMCADYMRKLGRTEATAWQSVIPKRRRLPFLSYSVHEYLEDAAIAAAIVNANDPGEGLRQIWRRAASMYLETPFGRSLLRLLRPSPLQYLRWLVDNRDHFCSYGRWRLIQHGDGYVTMEMDREYIWLQYAHRGGAESVLDVFDLDGSVEAEIASPYEGRLHIRWTPRAS